MPQRTMGEIIRNQKPLVLPPDATVAEACAAMYARRVGAVMTKDPTTLAPKASAMDAMLLLNDCGFRHLPIVAEGRVAGIVSRYDFRAREHARFDDETGFMEALR